MAISPCHVSCWEANAWSPCIFVLFQICCFLCCAIASSTILSELKVSMVQIEKWRRTLVLPDEKKHSSPRETLQCPKFLTRLAGVGALPPCFAEEIFLPARLKVQRTQMRNWGKLLNVRSMARISGRCELFWVRLLLHGFQVCRSDRRRTIVWTGTSRCLGTHCLL